MGVLSYATHTTAPPEARLALMTGCLGGFTTFSTFSAEVVDLIIRRLYGWRLLLITSHVVVSLILTIIGIAAARLAFREGQS